MDKNFKLVVNNELSFELNKSEALELNVVTNNDINYHILHKNKSYTANLIQTDFNQRKYTLSLNSKVYHLQIQDDLDALIDKMGYSESSSNALNSIFAPMPGIIIDLKIKLDDEVFEGDTLFILEAMKMENAIKSPKNGVVKHIGFKVGDAVEKGKLLIELE